jgi:hypothetical protein
MAERAKTGSFDGFYLLKWFLMAPKALLLMGLELRKTNRCLSCLRKKNTIFL